MAWLKAMMAEFIGLFVDSRAFAALIIVWLIAAGALLPRLHLPAAAPAVILFLGLALILAQSAIQSSAKRS